MPYRSFFAPPVSIGGKINGASGCVLKLDAGTFIVNASHVLAWYEDRIRTGRRLTGKSVISVRSTRFRA